MSFWYLQILPKNERKLVDLTYDNEIIIILKVHIRHFALRDKTTNLSVGFVYTIFVRNIFWPISPLL